METLTLEKLPYGNYKNSATSSFYDKSHLQQVRYAIRRHRTEIDKKSYTFFYIYDKEISDIPEWGKLMFIERHYAVGTLQRYLGALDKLTLNALIRDWELSKITFTERTKSELRYPN